MDNRKSNLILGILGYCIKIESLNEFRDILQDLITLLCSELVTETTMTCKERLLKLVASHVPPQDELDSEDVSTDFDDFNETIAVDSYKQSLSFKWVSKFHQDVISRAESAASGSYSDIENFYYLNNINFIIKTFNRLPLWSNVMVNVFKSASLVTTSAKSENQFKNIKTLLGQLPRRIDTFIVKHIDHLNGYFKEALGQQKIWQNQSATIIKSKTYLAQITLRLSIPNGCYQKITNQN